MSTVPTAKEWLENHKELSMYDVKSYDEGGYIGVDEKALYKIMIEFAKLHVESALKEASEDAEIQFEWSGGEEASTYYINEDSILNAYPLTNIK